jgi:hypothetical protein
MKPAQNKSEHMRRLRTLAVATMLLVHGTAKPVLAYMEAHALFELGDGDPSAEMLAAWCEEAPPFGSDLSSETALGTVCAAYLQGFAHAHALTTGEGRATLFAGGTEASPDTVCFPGARPWPKYRQLKAIFFEYYYDWENRDLARYYPDYPQKGFTPPASVMMDFALKDAFPCPQR